MCSLGELTRGLMSSHRIQDIAMWSLFNAGERDLEGWKALFKAADPKLELLKVENPAGSALSLLVLTLSGSPNGLKPESPTSP